MYTGQIMVIAGCVMAGLGGLLLLIVSIVFAAKKKELIRRIYGED